MDRAITQIPNFLYRRTGKARRLPSHGCTGSAGSRTDRVQPRRLSCRFMLATPSSGGSISGCVRQLGDSRLAGRGQWHRCTTRRGRAGTQHRSLAGARSLVIELPWLIRCEVVTRAPAETDLEAMPSSRPCWRSANGLRAVTPGGHRGFLIALAVATPVHGGGARSPHRAGAHHVRRRGDDGAVPAAEAAGGARATCWPGCWWGRTSPVPLVRRRGGGARALRAGRDPADVFAGPRVQPPQAGPGGADRRHRGGHRVQPDGLARLPGRARLRLDRATRACSAAPRSPSPARRSS